ncbi:unnamed protein product [Fusarium venenatum]|uniref:Xylanolytic transcriptional activator regulatory domain-containing protein n=1 Tax=Fusarium venenatum TaxID=56646 RepID=A0A2L2T3P1_9HYPO|nr:uncharacterized protein FVRRES_11129 [Fusarium venenatum]CEI38438.1 unnamed protein product [Fusarium venenatum]
MPTIIEGHQGNFIKPKPKRQEPRKRSPNAWLVGVAVINKTSNARKHSEKPDASEEEIETVGQRRIAPKEYQGPPTVLPDECLGTPKLAEARPRRTSSHDHTQARPEITFAYYTFLCINNLSSLHTDDVKYLESQGCFKVPEISCLDDLIRAFFRYAHPILPVINEAEFWSVYDPLASDGNNTRLPVILLSAMLFVACKYVEESALQGMQLGSAHEARERFLRKTQLLYDQDTESSPLVLAQVSLLLAHWTSQRSSRSSRHSTQWLGRAIQHSQDAISQVKLWCTLKIRYNQSNLRRVLGCCILSDRIHSMYNRRPLMVPPGMAEAEKDCYVLSRADLSHEIGRSRVYGVESKQKWIGAQEQMSALVTILGRVLALLYPQSGTATNRTVSTLNGDENEFIDCKNDLRTWYYESFILVTSGRDSALGSPVSPDDGREHGSSQHDPVELLTNMMYLHYETAMLALCQSDLLRYAASPRATFSTSRLFKQSFVREQKHHYLNYIANMTDRLSNCLQHQHLSQVPESMIFCTALPLLLHLLNIKAHLQPSLSSSRKVLGVQSYPVWVQRVMKCLKLHYKNDLEYILQVAKAVNDYLAQSLHESQEGQIDFDREDDGSQAQMSSWRELLDGNPRLFSGLIERLDTILSWGGELPDRGMGASLDDYHLRTGSAQTRLSRDMDASWTLTPPVSSAPSRRSTEQRSLSTSHGDETAAQVDVGTTASSFLNPEGLQERFNNVMQSYLNETSEETCSPASLDHSQGFWAEEIADGGRRGSDHFSPREEIVPIQVDSIDSDSMILEGGLSDDWIDALLDKEISLPGDNNSRIAEDIDMDAV